MSKFVAFLMSSAFLGLMLLAYRTLPNHNDLADNFDQQLRQANHLLSLNCRYEECITDGKIEYIQTNTIRGRSFNSTKHTHYYQYTFEHNSRLYKTDFFYTTMPGHLTDYIPSVGYNEGLILTERIIFDPNNPDINLPEKFARVIINKNNTLSDENTGMFIFGLMSMLFLAYRLFDRLTNENKKDSLF